MSISMFKCVDCFFNIAVVTPQQARKSKADGEVRNTAFRSSLGGLIPLIKGLGLRDCHKEVLRTTHFCGFF